MNRNNIWIHVLLAAVLVTFAAVFGQIGRWKSELSKYDIPPRAADVQRQSSSPEVIVRFKPGTSSTAILALTRAFNDAVVDRIEAVPGLKVIDDLDDADAEATARQYAELPEVLYAEANFVITLDQPSTGQRIYYSDERGGTSESPNDPRFHEQWALHNGGDKGGKEHADIAALDAWQATKGSQDVVVAVLDSGVDFTHIDLRENMWFRPDNIPQYTDNELGTINDLNGYNGTDAIADPMDDNGHGTHCAGIIGAEGDNGEGIAGINWQVRIMPLKFMGRGGFGTTNDAIEAINYAIDRKKKGVNLRIISASWGSIQRSKALEDTIRAAGDAGILFVAAAGNNSSNNDSWPHYPSNYDLPNMISVAALDRNDALASFSNFGKRSVHLAAPGKDILSTWLKDGYREASGTSMATPYVSGVAALIAAREPDISMQDLKKRLLESVDKLPSLDGKVATGGRLCAANALLLDAPDHDHK
jgi:thermitase